MMQPASALSHFGSVGSFLQPSPSPSASPSSPSIRHLISQVNQIEIFASNLKFSPKMACGSSCCGPPRDPPATASTDALSVDIPASDNAGAINHERAQVELHQQDEIDAHPTAEPTVQILTSPVVESDCQKGCCGPKVEEPPNQDDCGKGCCGPKVVEPPQQDDCGKGCCDSSVPEPVQSEEKDSCNAGCCSSNAAALVSLQKDDCCASDLEPTEDACEDGCCSKKAPKDPAKPDCCAGKPSPCCSTSCIDRIALRECQAGSDCDSCSDISQGRHA